MQFSTRLTAGSFFSLGVGTSDGIGKSPQLWVRILPSTVDGSSDKYFSYLKTNQYVSMCGGK